MKLSDQLREIHDSGDCGLVLENLSERAEIIEKALERLASCEAFTLSGYMHPVRDAELIARMEFASYMITTTQTKGSPA